MKIYCIFENHKAILENQIEAQKKGYPLCECDEAWNGEIWEKGYCPEKPESIIKLERIEELKALLAAADYWGQKYIDGEYTAEEWEEKKAQRKAWREEIRRLEGDE